MNESKASSRLVLTVLTVLPIGHRFVQKRIAPGAFGGSCIRLSSGAGKRLMDCFCCLSLWLYLLPLIIWLSSGWIGLLTHWQALAGVAFLLEKARLNPALRTILAGNELSEGELQCCLVESKAG